MNGDRKTIAVCHCHDLGPFPTTRRSNVWTPFFAPAKVASIKHSERSILPLLRRSSAKAFRRVSMTPSETHFWNQRWQVWYGGYLDGRSFQGAPVRMIHKMPLSTSLGFRGGLPLKVPLMALGMKDSIKLHCSSRISMYGLQGTQERSNFRTQISLAASDLESMT